MSRAMFLPWIVIAGLVFLVSSPAAAARPSRADRIALERAGAQWDSLFKKFLYYHDHNRTFFYAGKSSDASILRYWAKRLSCSK